MHRAVGQVDLRLMPGEGSDPEPRCCLGRVIDQGGLARSLAAPEHQHSAEAPADEVQKLINPGSLSASVHQGPLLTLPPARHEYLAARGRRPKRERNARPPADVAGHPLTPGTPC